MGTLQTTDLSRQSAAVRRAYLAEAPSGRPEAEAILFQPPLVSVIVSNFNYGRFLSLAIESVRAQTYPHVECIVVDDCSSDDSSKVIDQITRVWPEITIVRLEVNLGQSGAILKGLEQAHGSYVLLLDADDVLMADCVATHLAVHFSSRRAVGFTCCDSMQLVEGRVVAARNEGVSSAFLRFPVTSELVSTSAIEQFARCGLELPTVPAARLRHVPTDNPSWAWSTTSCMLFRRDALDLVCPASGLAGMRIGTDNYLANVVNLLTGSIVIDSQLVGYRIHGANGFSRRANLAGISGYDRKDDHLDLTLTVFMRDLRERFGFFVDVIDDPARLVAVAGLVSYWLATLGPDRRSDLVSLLTEKQSEWEPLVGPTIMQEMIAAAQSGGADIEQDHNTSPPASVTLSQSSIHEVAMEVWFEHQRWSLPYKLAKWWRDRLRKPAS